VSKLLDALLAVTVAAFLIFIGPFLISHDSWEGVALGVIGFLILVAACVCRIGRIIRD
jgi:hypothetical protein